MNTAPRLVADITESPIRSITVLIPIMNEEGNLPELYERVTSSLTGIGLPYEIIMVDDGSEDSSWEIISGLNRKDPRVIGLKHRRNFGKAQALSHGFAAARGDVVITADIPLASRCVKAGADAISPTGRAFTEASIGNTLATRNLMDELRSAGQITGGPRPFSPKDRSSFLSALDLAIVRLKRAGFTS